MESCSIIFNCFKKFFECILHVYYLTVKHLNMLKLQVLEENRANSIAFLHLFPKDLVVVLDETSEKALGCRLVVFQLDLNWCLDDDLALHDYVKMVAFISEFKHPVTGRHF